jgi:hypothetical protein
MTWRLKNSGVEMNPNLTGFMDALSLLVPFDLVVTSGFRTPKAQAAAMFTKIDLGEDLTKLYKNQSFANAVTEAYPNKDAAAAVIAEYAAAGGGSTHLRGVGIDLRTRDFTTSQRNELKAAVESMGNFALYEPTPPHMHIELKKNYGQKMNWPILAALVAGVFLWMKKPTLAT